MKDGILIFLAFVLWLAFIFFVNYAVSYAECYYAEIGKILGLVIFIGMLIFGGTRGRIVVLGLFFIALIVYFTTSLFSYKGVIPDIAEKSVACKK